MNFKEDPSSLTTPLGDFLHVLSHPICPPDQLCPSCGHPKHEALCKTRIPWRLGPYCTCIYEILRRHRGRYQ